MILRPTADEASRQHSVSSATAARLQEELLSAQASSTAESELTTTLSMQLQATRASLQEANEANKAAEQAQAEGEVLAQMTQELVVKLVQSQEQLGELQSSIEKQKPPKHVDVNKEGLPGRTKRRAVQEDLDYLHTVLTSRPWRPCDLTEALERADYLKGVFDTREARPPSCM